MSLQTSYHSQGIAYSDYLCYFSDRPQLPNQIVFHLTTDSNTFLTIPYEKYLILRDIRVSGRRLKSDYYRCQIILPDREFEIGGLIISKKELQYGNEITMTFHQPVSSVATQAHSSLQILRLSPTLIEFHELGDEQTRKRSRKTFQRLRPEPDEIWSSASE